MNQARFTAAIGTPLTEDELLHEEGLEAHLADQWASGISGVLVAGTMGVMQLLRDATYQRLVERSVVLSSGRGEVFVGAGDASYTRTRDRVEFLNGYTLDGVVILAPYFIKFGQEELVDYYRSLADVSRAPLYLYDLPVRTGTKLAIETVLELAKHPNIDGIKVSDEAGGTRQLIDQVGDSLRVICAQPHLVDVLLRHGVRDHLDGMYAVAPSWAVSIGRCAARENWDQAAKHQRDLSHLQRLILENHACAGFGAILNARGIPGNFAPKPCRRLSDGEREQLLADPIVQELVRECSVTVS